MLTVALAFSGATVVRQRRERAIEAEQLARFEERARVAREVHDVLAHSLAALTIQIERARLLAERGEPGGELATQLAAAHDLAARGLADARDVVGALRGDVAYDRASMVALIDRFAAATGTRCVAEIAPEVDSLTMQKRLVLYRAVQEALTNAVKHASPSRITVTLRADAQSVELVVTNDRGGAPEVRLAPSGAPAEAQGHGLVGIEERVALDGGTLVAAPTREGFELSLRIPR